MGGPGEFYTALNRSLETETHVAVATIVRTRGSSPREVGARMLIKPNGDTDGTVGGGCGEAEVWRAAIEVLADEQPRMVVVDLTNEIAINTDGVCGGIMDIFVEPWHKNGQDVAGTYGTLHLNSGGSYSYALANGQAQFIFGRHHGSP